MTRAGATRKRSVMLHGHATSVSLEDEYWAELKRMAAEAGLSVAALIYRIDAERRSANLSSALRLAVLDDLRRKATSAGGYKPAATA
ncbi:MAG TPA: ribbon-helix-helix domain-containing protein [Afifellaceae bacterium]|nr:ribbon-helix-helix domain-containing protein [Afifellaceae bacterium]